MLRSISQLLLIFSLLAEGVYAQQGLWHLMGKAFRSHSTREEWVEPSASLTVIGTVVANQL